MMGMWDMNDRNTVKMVTESIAQLERKVVYIIPFSQLRVDTRYAQHCVCRRLGCFLALIPDCGFPYYSQQVLLRRFGESVPRQVPRHGG
jgi:hypothetical protein